MANDTSRPFNPEPSYYPPMHGDIVTRVNQLRFIREYLRVSDMPAGAYMEFGVFNGESLLDAYRTLRGRVSHFYGFDTFAGLPTPSAQDADAHDQMPVFAAGNMQSMPCAQVRATILGQTGMPPDMLTLTEGTFAETLPAVGETPPVLVAYIDCDLHSSTMDVLNFLETRAVPGTWLLMDDYWCYRGSPNQGQQKALRDWQKTSRFGANDYGNFKGWGRAFVLYEK